MWKHVLEPKQNPSLGNPSVAEEAKDYDPTEEKETSTGAAQRFRGSKGRRSDFRPRAGCTWGCGWDWGYLTIWDWE